jgi:signal transduction histidine kinase/ActR/RegA family two-component response regulator
MSSGDPMMRPLGAEVQRIWDAVRPRLLPYGVALLTVLLSGLFLTIPLVREGGAGSAVSILFFAILISSWYGGLKPGLLATALIIATAHPGVPTKAWQQMRLALFATVGVTTSVLMEAMHAARRRAQDAAREAGAASRAKDRFLAVLSHELRTPLNPVMTLVSAMLDDASTGAELRRNLEMIRRNVELEARLIDDLLDAVRASRGKMSLVRRPVDAHALIRQAVEICRDGFDKGDVRLRLDLSAASHHVEADPVRFQQVIWNLVQNALKFTPEGGIVTVRTRDRAAEADEAGSLVVEVVDTGRGIEPEVLPRIFSAFEQGHAEPLRRHAGLGLGLAISRSIAEAHGGHLRATSPGLGLGATFTLTLPTCPAPALPTRHAPRAASKPARAGLRILLVEDNHDSRHLLAMLLRQNGHEVVTAADLASGRRAAAQHAIDLLISDIELPDGTGMELMREVAARGVPGIAMSGFASSDDIQLSREAEFAEHLAKPIAIDALLAAIARVARPEPAPSDTPTR